MLHFEQFLEMPPSVVYLMVAVLCVRLGRLPIEDQMTDLFSALKVYGPCPVVCLSCVHFAGAAYDQGGFLLAKKSGYCSLRIKKGDWNVLQRIDSPRQCKNFDEAPDEVKKQRLKALDYYGRKFWGDS